MSRSDNRRRVSRAPVARAHHTSPRPRPRSLRAKPRARRNVLAVVGLVLAAGAALLLHSSLTQPTVAEPVTAGASSLDSTTAPVAMRVDASPIAFQTAPRKRDASAVPSASSTPRATSASGVFVATTDTGGAKLIVIDKSSQAVGLYDASGTLIDSFLCATGRSIPPIGTYKVTSKKPASQSLYDPSRFYHFTVFMKSQKGNNVGFHSIPVNPDGTLVGGLGEPISHGCVRLDAAKAKFIYDWAPIGTKVVVRQ